MGPHLSQFVNAAEVKSDMQKKKVFIPALLTVAIISFIAHHCFFIQKTRSFSILRCSKISVIKVRFDIIGISENGTEYKYGYSLSKDYIPSNILNLYGDDWGTEKFSLHIINVAVPVDIQGRPLFRLPPEIDFSKSSGDNMHVDKINVRKNFRRTADYWFQGYEYVYTDNAGDVYYHAPQFDLISWSPVRNDLSSPQRNDFQFVPNFLSMPVDQKEVGRMMRTTPWVVKDGC